MRIVSGSVALGLLGAVAFTGVCRGQTPPAVVPPPAPVIRAWVHLDSPADLERLRATNFRHYLRARQIIAAADEICRPAPGHEYPAEFKPDHPECQSMLWLTSYPPKKMLTFHLDDVDYMALVSVSVNASLKDGPAPAAPLDPQN